jgi:L-ascorbate metabolism protein UlaG (beta-lactamase superfamily)
VRIRWLGTAGHVVSTDTTTVLIDPFLSRPTFRALLRPIEPDTSLFDRWLPPRVDAVLLGHSHYDHLLDAPAIALARGARVMGSLSTAAFARAAGVPDSRIDVVPPTGAVTTIGDMTITFVPSLHGRIALGRVPFPGEVHAPPSLPASFWRYRMGGAFGILIQAGERSIYHNGSADLVDAELQGLHADVLLIGLAGRRGTRAYLDRMIGHLSPTVVVPTHHDAFFGALDLGERLLPGIDLDGFFNTVKLVDPTIRIATPLYRDDLVVPKDGDARDLCVA